MKRLNIEQDTHQWHEWRKTLLTATDAGIILGENPYCTAYKLWQRKLGKIPPQVVTPPMLRGKIDEPRARDIFIQKYGINMTPVCIETEKYMVVDKPLIGASLDGMSDDGKWILEVKSQDIEKIKREGIPAFHMSQMQEQIMCGDGHIEGCYYQSIWGDSTHEILVRPDKRWQEIYLDKAQKFHENLLFDQAPELNPKDYKDMTHDSDWLHITSEYKDICYKIINLEAKKEVIRERLLQACGEVNCMGYGVKVFKKTIKGRIDYVEATEELNIRDDMLEHYRKPSTESWTVMVEKM